MVQRYAVQCSAVQYEWLLLVPPYNTVPYIGRRNKEGWFDMSMARFSPRRMYRPRGTNKDHPIITIFQPQKSGDFSRSPGRPLERLTKEPLRL